MKEQEVVGQAMLGRVAELFKQAVEEAATKRVKKYKTSNASLRDENAALKAKVTGMEKEREPLLKRAQEAEKVARERADRIHELNVTVSALQSQNAKMSMKMGPRKGAKART